MEDSAANVRNTSEFNEPTVVTYVGSYYLISGNDIIYKLGDDGCGKFATALSKKK